MSSLKLFLLGSPHIERDNKSIEIKRRKAVALFTYLAVTGQNHTRDALVALFWPQLDQTRGRADLRRTLSVLKKALGDEWLEVQRTNVALKRHDGFWLDVDHFKSLLVECEKHSHSPDQVCPTCLARLSEAVTLYRDDFLAGFTLRDSVLFDDWQFFQAEDLRRELCRALERLVRGYCAHGKFESAITHAQRWLVFDPLYEPAHRLMMNLYAQTNRHTNALQQYQKCVRVLERELGVSPQEATTQLYQAIRESRTSQPVSPDLLPTPAHPHNLPLESTPFVGRKDELATIARLLQDPACRMLSLVGPGGSGKTRLAIQAAAEKGNAFSHGVHFISLAPQRSPHLLASTIASALQFPFHGPTTPQVQLLNYLRTKEMLLVLDSFEHILIPSASIESKKQVLGTDVSTTNGETGGIDLLVEILSSAPSVKLLITSREHLNLQWEWLFEVQGLRFPQYDENIAVEEYDAVQLFLQRAGRTRRGFALTAEKKLYVTRICQFLEGLPLGIELAAAWLQVFSCREIAQRIEHSLDFLVAAPQDLPKRHHSLRAAFDHSWNLLSEQERSTFSKLAVFRGGFRGEDAAKRVAGASLPLLLALTRKSLLHRSPVGRYEMLEVLRQYAEEKLERIPQERDTARDRHCEFYTEFLHQRQAHLEGQRQTEALEEIGKEIENVRAAWQWALAHKKEEAIGKALKSLYHFYTAWNWFQEGEQAFGRAVEALRDSKSATDKYVTEGNATLGKLLARQGWFCFSLYRLDRARELSHEGLAIARRLGMRKEMAFALITLGHVAWKAGNYAKAKRECEESLAICTQIREIRGMGACLNVLGALAFEQGKYREAKQFYQKSLAINKELGDRRKIANNLNNLGVLASALSEYDEAEQFYQESFTIYEEVGSQKGIAYSFFNLGTAALRQKKYVEASRWYREGLVFGKEINEKWTTASCLTGLGLAVEALSEYDKAKSLHLEALKVCEKIDDQGLIAFCLNNLGFSLCALEEYTKAKINFEKALAMAIKMQTTFAALNALSGIATLLLRTGEKEKALELVAYVHYHPATHPETTNRTETLFSEIKTQLDPQTFAEVQERGKARTLEHFTNVYAPGRLEAETQ